MTFNLKSFFPTVVVVMTLMSFGCSDFLKGKPAKQDYIEVKKENLACLKDIPNQVRLFFKSEATKGEVDETFHCIDQALVEFQNRAEGTEDAHSFSTEDLFKIFSQFVSDAKISKQATLDILKLKAAVLGGSDQSLTKTELSQLREFLKSLKAEVHLLLPYAELFTFKKTNSQQSKATIETAFKQLNSSLNRLLVASQMAKSRYEFEDFKNLFVNLKIFESEDSDLLDLALEVKNLLIGQIGLQTQADYTSFIASLTEVLRLYSLQTQGHVVFEIRDSQNVADAIEYIEGWLKTLENSIQYKKTKIIAVESLDPLISKIAKKDILPVKVKPETLVQFYKTIVIRGFESGPNADVSGFSGLRKIHFVNLRREIAAFKASLKFIDSLPFSSQDRLAISDIQKALRGYDFSKSKTVLDLDPRERPHIVGVLNELHSELLTERPVIYRFNKVVIAANQEEWKQNWQDMVRALYVKFLARELMIGWGNAIESRLVKNAQITEPGLVKWYAEFKQFGVEMKLFDPRSLNSGAKSFKEANLFPYAADGNDKMSFLETIQYLNILASGGGESFNEFKTGFAKAQCNLKEIDAFGYPWNDESCALADLKMNYKFYFNNLSYLSAYMGKLIERGEFEAYYESVMSVARNNPETKGRIETADIRNFTILMHYIESIYAQYDVDRNWSFSHREIRAAYPRFKKFATDFAYKSAKDKIDLFNSPMAQTLGYGCYSEQDLIRESFIFLVYKGTTPGMTDLNIAPCLGQRSLIDFHGEVERKTIINTFKILKGVLGS